MDAEVEEFVLLIAPLVFGAIWLSVLFLVATAVTFFVGRRWHKMSELQKYLAGIIYVVVWWKTLSIFISFSKMILKIYLLQ